MILLFSNFFFLFHCLVNKAYIIKLSSETSLTKEYPDLNEALRDFSKNTNCDSKGSLIDIFPTTINTLHFEMTEGVNIFCSLEITFSGSEPLVTYLNESSFFFFVNNNENLTISNIELRLGKGVFSEVFLLEQGSSLDLKVVN